MLTARCRAPPLPPSRKDSGSVVVHRCKGTVRVLEDYIEDKVRKRFLADESAVGAPQTSPHGHVPALVHRAMPHGKLRLASMTLFRLSADSWQHY